MRILLTGGTGFIGRNLAEHLSQTHQVHAPGHAELELVDSRAVDTWFQEHEVDAVVHTAVRPGHRAVKDPSDQLRSNLRMFFNIVRNSDRFERLVFISSGAVYDTREELVRVSENRVGMSVPEDEHGLSKYVIARYLEAMGGRHGPGLVELRLLGVFGRYEDYRIRFISNAICRTLFHMPVALRQDRRFSYLFIDDLMPVIDWALTGKAKQVAYNVVPDWTDTLYEIGSLISRKWGAGQPLLLANDQLGREYSAANSRLREELPRLEFTPTEVAIGRLFRWYADRRSLIDPSTLRIDE